MLKNLKTLLGRTFILPLIASMFFAVSCEDDVADNGNGNGTPSTPDACDTILHACAPYPIGVAVNPSLLGFQNYGDIVATQFNSITAENIFKPGYLHPQPDQFSFGAADDLVDYAEENDQRVHGHVLVWHSQIPQWMEDYQGTEAQWDSMMKVHIQTIVTHFKGRVESWDVVNEAFLDGGNFRSESPFYEALGPDYIKKAFQYAHEADPDALLFYNDYNMIQSPTKRNAVINFFEDLRAEGVPVHGIGLQTHIDRNTSDANIIDAINDVANADFMVHMSEIDVNLNPNQNPNYEPSAEDFRDQALIYEEIVKAYRAIPEEFQFGLTVWGVADHNSWRSEGFPLLYDEDYEEKPAFLYFKRAL